MTRLTAILLSLSVLASGALPVVAVGAPSLDLASADSAALATLDVVLTKTSADVDAALLVLGQNSKDADARTAMLTAATDAIAALDAVTVAPCFADWWALTRTAYWLLKRSIEDIEAYDRAQLDADPATVALVLVDIGVVIPHGIALFHWTPTVRAEVAC